MLQEPIVDEDIVKEADKLCSLLPGELGQVVRYTVFHRIECCCLICDRSATRLLTRSAPISSS